MQRASACLFRFYLTGKGFVIFALSMLRSSSISCNVNGDVDLVNGTKIHNEIIDDKQKFRISRFVAS